MFPDRPHRPFLAALVLAAAGPFFVAGELAAGADARKPYHLTVVLHFANNRQLTSVFRQQVERELRDGLQAAYGDLARVDVTREHPRLDKVLALGLGQLEQALAGWDAGGSKTHFVLFDYANGQYQVRARQFDGPSGQVGPVVRSERTPNPVFVARVAALLVNRDFGLAGTFAAWPRDAREQPGAVTLDLQGAELGVPLSRWVKKGDVFSVVRMPAGGGTGQPVPFALVQAQEAPDDSTGSCPGRLFWRYQPPSDSGGGYRCLRMGSGKEVLRLRFVQPRPGGGFEPARNLNLEVRRRGFTGEEHTPVTGVTEGTTGFFTPPDPAAAVFDRVAFVTAKRSPWQARIPVPLLDDQPVVIPVEAFNGAGDLTALRVEDWRRDLSASWLVHATAFEAIARLANEGKRAEALKEARRCQTRTRDDFDRLNRARDDLVKEAREAEGSRVPDFSKQEPLLKKLQEGQSELDKFIQAQVESEAAANSPEVKAARERIDGGKLLERELEYGKAIAAYEEALRGGLDDAALRSHLDKLKAEWQTKGDKHKEARDFIYNVWPTLKNTAALEGELKRAQEAFGECKRVHDLVGPRKLELETDKHAGRLEEEFRKLRPDINIDDQKPAERIQKVSEKLAGLARELAEYLRTAGPAPAPPKK